MRTTNYSVGDRRIRREEVIGREGEPPPILIHWYDNATGEWLGSYSFVNTVHCAGPMFAVAA